MRITPEILESARSSFTKNWVEISMVRNNLKDHELYKYLFRVDTVLSKLVDHYEGLYKKKHAEPSVSGQIHAEWTYNMFCYISEKFNIVWNKFIANNADYLKANKERIIREKLEAINEDF
jgi:hypothetical protein